MKEIAEAKPGKELESSLARTQKKIIPHLLVYVLIELGFGGVISQLFSDKFLPCNS